MQKQKSVISSYFPPFSYLTASPMNAHNPPPPRDDTETGDGVDSDKDQDGTDRSTTMQFAGLAALVVLVVLGSLFCGCGKKKPEKRPTEVREGYTALEGVTVSRAARV
eukprot:GDKI01040863.1.p1 GENE.GDKI01040863.1~~GDKI01040863.1.p1  ORF type:complete len:108 (-),score=21.18 GDKI01040863.1:278-601(-)